MKQHKTLLITGAGGFVGAAAVEKALVEGDNVVAVLRDKGGHRNTLPTELKDLMRKSKSRNHLKVEYADLTDPQTMDALFEKYPVDQVLHTAATVRVADNPQAIADAYTTNVTVTENMAKAAEKSAAARDTVIQFHCVSSIAALKYEKNAVIQSPGQASLDYARQKAESTAYFKTHSGELSHLDVSITYPLFLIGDKPSKTVASQMLRASFEKVDGRPIEMHKLYKERNVPENAGNPLQMTHLNHYLDVVFGALKMEPKALRVEEYSVKPDYEMTLGELVQLCDQVINHGRQKLNRPFRKWDGMDTPFAMDFEPRELPSMPNMHSKHIDLQETLWRQYQTLQKEQSAQRSA